jgi:hypothetical protein
LVRRIITTLVVATIGLAFVSWAALADLRWFEHHALTVYCNTSPRFPAMTTRLRVVIALLGVFSIAWIAPRAGRWAQRRSMAQMLGTILTVIVPVILALGAAELIVRRVPVSPPVSQVPYLPPMHTDEKNWFANTPSASKDVKVQDHVVRYFTDARGDRAPDDHTQPDPEAPTILIAGESIAFGYELPYELSCAALLAKALGVQVVNVSVTGFAIDQAYERLAGALAWFKHPIATITFVVPEAIHRNLRSTSSRYALAEDGTLHLIGKPQGWLAQSALLRAIDRVLPLHTDELIGLTHAILRETVRMTEAHGARAFFVMTNYGAPCLADAEGTPRLARELFEGIGGPYIIVDILAPERIGGPDMHPNESGEQRLTAAILSEISPVISPPRPQHP